MSSVTADTCSTCGTKLLKVGYESFVARGVLVAGDKCYATICPECDKLPSWPREKKSSEEV